MKRASRALRSRFLRRLHDLGVSPSPALLDAWVQQNAIVITVDRPEGGVEWCYGWDSSHWEPIRRWAMAYFDS